MAEIYFEMSDMQVQVRVEFEGAMKERNVQVSPQIVGDILSAVQDMLDELSLTPADITKSEKTGELRGSSAMRAVSVVSDTLGWAGSRSKMTK